MFKQNFLCSKFFLFKEIFEILSYSKMYAKVILNLQFLDHFHIFEMSFISEAKSNKNYSNIHDPMKIFTKCKRN